MQPKEERSARLPRLYLQQETDAEQWSHDVALLWNGQIELSGRLHNGQQWIGECTAYAHSSAALGTLCQPWTIFERTSNRRAWARNDLTAPDFHRCRQSCEKQWLSHHQNSVRCDNLDVLGLTLLTVDAIYSILNEHKWLSIGQIGHNTCT